MQRIGYRKILRTRNLLELSEKFNQFILYLKLVKIITIVLSEGKIWKIYGTLLIRVADSLKFSAPESKHNSLNKNNKLSLWIRKLKETPNPALLWK